MIDIDILMCDVLVRCVCCVMLMFCEVFYIIKYLIYIYNT